MSKGSANVHLIGNVGGDPETRYTPNGTMVCNFSVAVNNRKREEGMREDPPADWYRIVTFGKLAEIVDQYISKGNRVYVAGRQQIDNWTGQDGRERTTVEIVASEVNNLTPRDNNGQQSSQRPQQQDDDDELNRLPF